MDYKSKDKTNEKDIIIQIVQDLSKISQQEFKGGFTNVIFRGDNIEKVYIEDPRKKYCQLIDFLSDLLLPRYNDKMIDAYKKIVPDIEELIKKYNNPKEKMDEEEYIIEKVRLCRLLLQHLFILLKEINWTRPKTTIG